MLAIHPPSAAAAPVVSDWSGVLQLALHKQTLAEVGTGGAVAGDVSGRRRERVEKRREKGCSDETFMDLVSMAKNPMHFIELCAAEADNRCSNRKHFRDAKARDRFKRGPLSHAETMAWRKRPLNCDSMKQALLHYSRRLKGVGEQKAESKHDLLRECRQIDEALQKIDKGMNNAETRSQFPDSGGLFEMKKAAAASRAEDDRLVAAGRKPMTNTEKLTRWPCLAPGWPDQDALLREEVELRLLESGRCGLQQPDAPVTSKKRRLSTGLNSPSLTPRAAPPDFEAPGGEAHVQDVADDLDGMFGDEDADYPLAEPDAQVNADRRFDAEPVRGAVAKLSPELVQAFANELERKPCDLSDFDPVQVANLKSKVKFYNPTTRRPRMPTRKDLIKKGLLPLAARKRLGS